MCIVESCYDENRLCFIFLLGPTLNDGIVEDVLPLLLLSIFIILLVVVLVLLLLLLVVECDTNPVTSCKGNGDGVDGGLGKSFGIGAHRPAARYACA